ncbi:ABC transporter permease [Pandoraea pneumonica]|jgi:NitT/TauT family transport system permease protein|uniref:ABC transporter permease n=1 Tax=Pandoraea pneumonica TaxID=2508299 RepID=A0A5E4VNT3_9BURK|nr:ABC transporter permease [Pandoraea pneumonica]VVE13871.1 ABC transporter permease [Pandoraea pneumonica]
MSKMNLRAVAYPALGIAVVIVLWQAYVTMFHVPIAVLPTPAQIAQSFIEDRAALVSQGWVTLQECVYGFGLAFIVGVPIAFIIANSPVLNRMFYPLLIAMQSVPKVALAPIILVWLGTGIESKLALVWLVAFFPIVVDTAAGLRTTPVSLLELATSLRATRMQIFTKIQMPAALPHIVSGAKIAVTLAVIGAVIGEFVGSNEGLGNLLLVANSQINTPLAFAALISLAILGLGLYGAVALIEVALRPWLPHTAEAA